MTIFIISKIDNPKWIKAYVAHKAGDVRKDFIEKTNNVKLSELTDEAKKDLFNKFENEYSLTINEATYL